jgi:GNAT superfamily N-acetyltransferase
VTRTANEPALAFRIVDLGTLEASDASRFARLFAGFARIYHAAFPDASEREREEDWIARLKGREPPPQPEVLVVLAVADGDRVLGGVCVEHYRTSRCGLVTYIAVERQHRGAGIARTLMRSAVGRLEAAARDQGTPLHAVFAEAEDPAKVDPGLRETARERLLILGRFGARAVDLRYVQPELSGGGGRARHLVLLRLDGDDAPIDRALVWGFMHEFYRALGISDPEADTDFAAMFAGAGATVGTRALPNEAPGRAAMAGTDRSGCG